MRLVNGSFVPSSQRTSILYCRLADFKYKKLATAPCDQKRKSSLKHANIPNYFLFQLNIHVFTLIYDLNWRKTWVLVLGMVTPKNQYFLLLNPVMTHLVMDFKIFPWRFTQLVQMLCSKILHYLICRCPFIPNFWFLS